MVAIFRVQLVGAIVGLGEPGGPGGPAGPYKKLYAFYS